MRIGDMSTDFDGAWTLERLLDAERKGERLKYLAFWGHRPRHDGQLGPYVLSQWFEHEFGDANGRRHATAEHFMMAAKAELFGDDATHERILRAKSAGEAKDLGRRVVGFDETTWQAHRSEIVTAASVAKFGSCARLWNYLVGTGHRVLVEASPLDLIWGIGADARSGLVERPSAWTGHNLLGFALMRARAELAAARPPAGDCTVCGSD